MSEVVKTYLNSDFQFVNLNIKKLDQLSDKVVESMGIRDWAQEDDFKSYGFETYSFS